jgi:hypothetical protein
VKSRLTELGERRLQLQLKAAAQREQLAVHVQDIEDSFHSVGSGLLNVRGWFRQPLLLGGVAALAFFMGPGRALRLLGKTVLVISAARRLLPLLGLLRFFRGSSRASE